MKSLFWNVRGLANSSSRLALKRLISSNKPDLVFVAEPWMDYNKLPKAWLHNLDLKLFALNQRGDLLPNLWCFCKTNLNPDIISVDDQHVSFTIKLNNTTLCFSAIYASTSYICRRSLWHKLSNVLPNVPWCFIGDFNAIISSDEYRGNHSPSKIPMTDFFNWSNDNHYIHLPTVGNFLTWSNGRKGRNLTEKRLDRAICNTDFLDACCTLVCSTLPRFKSDHFPILLTFEVDKISFKSQFKFLRMWSSHNDCINIIQSSWNVNVTGCPMFILDRKLRILKKNLKTWNNNVFGNVINKVEEAETILKEIQADISSHGYDELRHANEIKAQNDLEMALNVEEEFWKEKTRLNWLVDGDRNTRFFHQYAKIRRKIKVISALRIREDLITDNDILENHIESHFANLFNSRVVLQDNGMIQGIIPSMVDAKTNDLLTLTPSAEEIHNAIFSLNADSAPGPDGFGAYFFQKYWDVIKLDVINVVCSFFLQSWIPSNYNTNTIVLNPKTNSAYSLNQFRPIALANFKYKIISKILADRLSSILPSLISPEQKGFIHGRNIKDCICLTSEAINLLNNRSFSGNVALKIDISKAFDTLSWPFIIKTLECFGFNEKFCNWIKVILNSAHLSIGFNGKLVGYFKCSNGVRQGDPLSPLLFCLAEEVLSRGIKKLVNENKINLIKASRNYFVPSHTLYADDIMIFCRGDHKSLTAIAAFLHEYASYSGQFCNFAKSLIFAGGMSTARHQSLADLLGFSTAFPPFIYLGAPIFVGRPKASHFQFVADRIHIKLAAWKASLLSMAGRVQLVKSVIHSMMIHYMTVYNWPASIIKNIEKWMRNFIWSGNLDKKKLVTVSWKICCKDLKEGGLGIKSLRNFNSASNALLCWNFLRNKQDWAMLLAARVRRNNNFINYSISSSIWSSIKGSVNTVLENSQWVIGNGKSTLFWLDNWLGDSLVNILHIPKVFHRHLTSKICDYVDNNNWSFHDNVYTAFPSLLERIKKIIHLPLIAEEDDLIWKELDNGHLNLKSAYRFFHASTPAASWKTFLWSPNVPPSHSMIVWRLINNKIPTDENMSIRGFAFPSICNLCNSNQETSQHLFFDCVYVRKIWDWLYGVIDTHLQIHSIKDCYALISASSSPQAGVVLTACFINVFVQVWKARNLARFENKVTHWKTCITNISAMAKMVGNNTKKSSNSSMINFSLLKRFDIRINPTRSIRHIDVLWSPPPVGWIKGNIDGVASGSPSISSCGGIFRDHMGDHIGSFCNFLGEGIAELAEYSAVMVAIEKAQDCGWQKLWLESDCIIVVNAFSNSNLVPWIIKSRWLKRRSYTLSIDFMITHIYREANFCVDILASLGLKLRNFCWFSHIVPDIRRDFLLDKDGTPRLRLLH
ncbi:uncharacterized protein LOC131629842 [Vicia villosa]|uniref:uncharacterized protein LOC131629842 n=1 Tax=Vicia villosa TaxID=3911 RepID=UPI00273C75D8|nr:uncharacterized protein LOC131629842 [Vicia villosa]